MRGAVVGEQSAASQCPESAGGLLGRQSLADHDIAQHVGDAQTGGARTVDNHPLVSHPRASRPNRGDGGGEHHGSRALHVVVECAELVGVPVQDPPGVAGAEVLPVQHRPGEQLGRCPHVGVDELVVALLTHPRVPVAQVHLVVEQAQVVGAHVQHDGDHPAGMQPGCGGVDGQLADGNIDAADSLVTDAEDALRVGRHQQVDVLGAEPVVAQ